MAGLPEFGNRFVRNIREIDPGLYYVQSWLTGIVSADGKAGTLADRMRKLREAGKMKWRPGPKGQGIAYLGKDIIEVHATIQRDHEDFARRVEKFTKQQTPETVYQICWENLRWSERSSRIAKREKRLRSLEDENAMLRQRLSSREERQRSATDLAAKRIVHWLTNSQPAEMLSKDLIEGLCGIYVLYLDDVPVYVGQSVNIPSRLATHAKEKEGQFNSARFFRCAPEELNDKERFLIRILQPRLNATHKNGKEHALWDRLSVTRGGGNHATT